MSTQRQPKGIPSGGQFAASAHDEAGASLAVDHDTLMEVGETREMPLSFHMEHIGTERDEESGVETVTISAEKPEYGGLRNWDDDEDRVAMLAFAEGITGSVKRVEGGKPEWAHYTYEVTLENPTTGETYTSVYGTGSGITETPTVDRVLHSAVMDANSARGGVDIQEWAEESGLEPDYEAQYERDDEDIHHSYRASYDACVAADEDMSNFLGRRYETYLYGSDDGDLIVEVAS